MKSKARKKTKKSEKILEKEVPEILKVDGLFEIISLYPVVQVLDIKRGVKILIEVNEIFSQATLKEGDVVLGSVSSEIIEGKTTLWHFTSIKEKTKHEQNEEQEQQKGSYIKE